MRRITACSTAFLVAILAAARAEASGPWLTAKSAAVGDRNGAMLWERNAAYKAPPASTAKVMAALVALERVSPETRVTVSRRAASQEPTKIGVRAGETFRVEDLVRAALINSGNDAACALAEGVAGSEWRFAVWMTEKAKKLGARRTVFKRASGLPAQGQVTTASDLVTIMQAALTNAFIRKVMSIKETWIESGRGRRIRLRNHNRLLWDGRRPVYLKTGYTRASRHCYVGYVGKKGEYGVFAFLTARKPWPDVRALADWCLKRGPHIEVNRRLLKKPEVRDVQRLLKRKGFDPGPVDGLFGPRTLQAVLALQKARGLTTDGIVGPRTKKALGMEK